MRLPAGARRDIGTAGKGASRLRIDYMVELNS